MSTETVTATVAEPSSSTATSESAAPVETSSIAADVIKSIEGGGTGAGSGKSAVDVEAEADAKAEAEAKAAGKDPDDFSAVPERDPSGRINRIPHTRVASMVKAAERKVIAGLAKELGISKAEAELKLEDLTGEITTRSGKLKTAEERLNELDAIGKIMDSDEDRFIQVLAQANPRYKKFAALLEKAAEKAEETADEGPPPPDIPLGEGKATYSEKGLERRIAYDVNKAVKKALEAQRAEFEKEFGPIRQKYAADTASAADEQRVAKALERASTWPGYKEHQAEIEAAYLADKTLSLHDAYIKVVPGKWKAEVEKAKTDEAAIEARVREKVLKEINEAPASTSTSPSKSVARKDSEIRDTSDIAREVMKELEGK